MSIHYVTLLVTYEGYYSGVASLVWQDHNLIMEKLEKLFVIKCAPFNEYLSFLAYELSRFRSAAVGGALCRARTAPSAVVDDGGDLHRARLPARVHHGGHDALQELQAPVHHATGDHAGFTKPLTT